MINEHGPESKRAFVPEVIFTDTFYDGIHEGVNATATYSLYSNGAEWVTLRTLHNGEPVEWDGPVEQYILYFNGLGIEELTATRVISLSALRGVVCNG